MLANLHIPAELYVDCIIRLRGERNRDAHQRLWKVSEEHMTSTGCKAEAHKAAAAAQLNHVLSLLQRGSSS